MSQPVGEPVPGWKPPQLPGRRVLEGRYVTVRPLEPTSVSGLWESYRMDDGGMWTYMSYGPFAGEEDLAAQVRTWQGSVDPLVFTFDVAGRPRGWGAYLRADPGNGSIEVGHLAYGPDLRRTRAATEAMWLMMGNVFDLGYRRYEWKCDVLNLPSRRAAERLGFTFEGIFRQHMIYKGRNRDTAWYSVIDAEWPRIDAAFRQWLDPGNFDGDGRQRTRLAARQTTTVEQQTTGRVT